MSYDPVVHGTNREKIQVFVVHEPGGYYAVCEGQEFGYMASQNEDSRRKAWQKLIRIMALTILELRHQRNDLLVRLRTVRPEANTDNGEALAKLQEEINRRETHRKIEEAATTALQNRYDALNATLNQVTRHRNQLLRNQIAIRGIMDAAPGTSGEGE